MNRMFADYGFRLSLAPVGSAARITIESFCTPRNPFYSLLNALVMKRQFSGVLDGLLAGLRVTPPQRSVRQRPFV